MTGQRLDAEAIAGEAVRQVATLMGAPRSPPRSPAVNCSWPANPIHSKR
jgi:hypothetical protein